MLLHTILDERLAISEIKAMKLLISTFNQPYLGSLYGATKSLTDTRDKQVMRLFILFLAIILSVPAQAQISDLLTSAALDAMAGRAGRDTVLHERPNYSIWLLVRSDKDGAPETLHDMDSILFVRRGSAVISLAPALGSAPGASRRIEAGPGDFVKIPAGTTHQIEPVGGHFESLAVRIATVSATVQARTGMRPAKGQMPELLKRSEIDATFATSSANRTIHTAPNFTMNYVIYPESGGPWEAHAGCVDIYFMHTGTATAQVGGEIQNTREEVPGEPRGDGVTDARSHAIGPRDLVVIPRDTAHHMAPTAAKLGYVLMKVWVD